MLALVLLMLAAMLLLVGVIERAVGVLSGNLPSYLAAFFAQTDKIWAWLGAHGIELPEATLRDSFNPQILLRHAGTVASTLGDFLVTTFIVVLVAIFILLEGSALPDKMRGVHGLSSETWNRLSQIVADVRRYMFLKTVMSLLTGALIALWLLALGVDFPIAARRPGVRPELHPDHRLDRRRRAGHPPRLHRVRPRHGRAHHGRLRRDQHRRQQRHRAPLSRRRPRACRRSW